MEDLEKLAALHREMAEVYEKFCNAIMTNQDQAERICYLDNRLSEEIDLRCSAPKVPVMNYTDTDNQANSFAGEVGRILIHIGRTPSLQTYLAETTNKIVGIKAIKASFVCGLKAAKYAYETWMANPPTPTESDPNEDDDYQDEDDPQD